MRGMYTDAILMAIAERPGIRAVEIADKVDCDIEAVERSIREEIDSGNVRREVVNGPNAKPTLAFWMKNTPAMPAPPKVEPNVQPAPPLAQPVPVPAAAAPAPEVPAAKPAPVVAAPAKTKVELAMDFVRGQPGRTATDDELRVVMNLSKDSYPASFLSTQMKHGYLIKIDGLWHLRDGKKEVAQVQAQPVADPVSGEFRCALWSDGELQLARGAQIAMRLSTAEVGQLRNYLAGGQAP